MDYTKVVPLTELVSARRAEIKANAKTQAKEEARQDAAHQLLTVVVTAMAIDCLSETLGIHRDDIAEIIAVQDWQYSRGHWSTPRRTFESPHGSIDLPQKITVKFLFGRVTFYTELYYQTENTAPYYRLAKGAEPFSSFGRGAKKFSSFADAVIWAQERNENLLADDRREAERETAQHAEREVRQHDKEDERDALLDALGDDPIAIHLLKLFLAIQRERDGYGERIDALDESLDRSTETAAASIGDLQTEIESIDAALSQERAGRQYAEDELYTERRKRERSR